MNQPLRFGPVPVRFSSRKGNSEKDTPLRPLQGENQQDEMFRFIAKIRSLQDDIHNLRNQNRQVETDNENMVNALNEFENTRESQTAQIQRLTQELQQHNSSGSTILYFEEQLKAVGQEVETLHQLIAEKNRRYEVLKDERDRAIFQQLKLKQQCNQLQYQENKLLEGLDELIERARPESDVLTAPIETKLQITVEYCSSLERQVQQIGALLEKNRREGANAVMLQKEKRIKSSYNIELLRQRWKDYEIKRNYFKNCYNQESIQTVIDDMLMKENSLREKISLQSQKNERLREERKEALIVFEKRVAREKIEMQELLKNEEIEHHLIRAKKEKVINDIRKAEKKLIQIQEEGYQVTQESREKESQIYKQISEIQNQNIMLEKELGALRRQIDVLQLGMN